ncbi:MAG: hypothetical protein AseanaTS_27840 [Candidatus Pelagadaptatus aseana]
MSSVSLATFNYYPYQHHGEGMMIELYREALAMQNIRLDVHIYPILRGVAEMLEHKVDAFSPGLFFIDDALAQGQVTVVPTFRIQYGWFYKGDNDPRGRQDLTGTILVTPTPVKSVAPYDQFFHERGAKIETIESPDRLLRMVASERATFASAPLLPGWLMLKKFRPQQLDQFGFAAYGPLMCTLAFSTSNPRTTYLKAQFEQGLQVIIANGSYLQILERYWGKGNVPQEVLPESIRYQGSRHFDVRRLPQHPEN